MHRAQIHSCKILNYVKCIFMNLTNSFVLCLPASKCVRSQTNDDNEQPIAKKSKAKGEKKMVFDDFEDIKIRRPKLVVNIGVKSLVDAIEKMNSKQLVALEEMGFGNLFISRSEAFLQK